MPLTTELIAGTTVTLDTLTTGRVPAFGMSVSGTGIAAGTTVVSYASNVVTLSAATTADLADDAALTFGGGVGGVTVLGASTGAATANAFSNTSGITTTTNTANVVGTVGNTVNFKYGAQTGSYLVGATASATATNFAAALNAVAGSTIAAASSGNVAVTAPTAGTSLETITFTGAPADTPSVTFTTANVAGVGNAQYDLSGFTGLTDVTSASEGAVNVKLATTTDANIATTSGNATIAGGKDITLTHAALAANTATVAAGADVTVTANKATTGSVTISGATGTVNAAYNGTFANTADATNGGVTVSKGGSSISVAATSGAAGATLASTNHTVAQAPSVTGGASTSSVTAKQMPSNQGRRHRRHRCRWCCSGASHHHRWKCYH